MNSSQVKNELKKFASNTKAVSSARFFKTAKGQYGFGDKFFGVTVPNQRLVAKKYSKLSLVEIEKLLKSKIHEQRLTALIILVGQYKKSDLKNKDIITSFYLKNKKYINNWDLVDTSAPNILGDHIVLKRTNIQILDKLSMSQNIWDKRISILATFSLIRNADYGKTIELCSYFINDKNDLIHKACGWMLREVGKKSKPTLLSFLKMYSSKMPRTMLRYSIEHLNINERKFWLKK